MPDINDEFEHELIKRAGHGDAEAGRELLKTISLRITGRQFDSPLFDYLADCLWQHLEDGVPLERALGVEEEDKKGGRPKKYDPVQ